MMGKSFLILTDALGKGVKLNNLDRLALSFLNSNLQNPCLGLNKKSSRPFRPATNSKD